MSFEIALTHAFPRMTLDINLTGDAGITALFGPSGAGKTSILRALTGELRPQLGRATVGGNVVFDTNRGLTLPAHKRAIGAVYQDGRLFPHLTALQNIQFSAPYTRHRAPLMSEEEMVTLLGISALLDRMPATLSGGEAQRVALARALSAAPDMLVMDEPLAALDGPRKDAILPYLDRLKRSANIPILYVTHSVEEVAHLADQVALIQDGSIQKHGSVFDVLSDPAAMPFLGVREAGSVMSATVDAVLPNGLMRLSSAAGILELPAVPTHVGDTVRLRIRAQDIILAKSKPKGLSARNILPATIASISPGRGPGAAIVLQIGDQTLLTRITDASRADLALSPGQEVFAIIKATSVARPMTQA